MKKIGRREATKRALTVLGAATLAPAALAACGGESSEGPNCNDQSGLQPNQINMRTQQQYVEASTNAERQCNNCNFYSAPTSGECGACSVLLNSPVNPNGYCNLWAAAAN